MPVQPRTKSPELLHAEEQFGKLAARHGGRVLFRMSQGDFREYWEKDAGGKCNGISILWLRHQHSELQSRAFAFFDEKKNKMVQLLEIRYRELKERHEKLWGRAQAYFEASQTDRFEKFTEEEQQLFGTIRGESDERVRRDEVLKADPFAKVLHQKMHLEGQKYDSPFVDREWDRERLNELFRQWDMHYERTKVFAGGWGKGHTDLGKFVARPGTASMLHTKKHAMAACNTLGKPRFFDPNFGAVEFSNGSRLGSFLSDFFKVPLINSKYGDHAKYKKLEVEADRYHYEVNRVYTIH